MDVYVEAGKRRCFAGAVAWPGWCRAGRTPEEALDALIASAPRYARVAGRSFKAPKSAGALRVVERLRGDATTDFGAPSIAPRADAGEVSAADLRRLTGVLDRCWKAFDAAAETHARATLSTGPRGGGRSVPAMAAHVNEADRAYLTRLGVAVTPAGKDASAIRAALLDAIRVRVSGKPFERNRATGRLWTPRFAVRRSAWHALDHAWEIEDRAGG